MDEHVFAIKGTGANLPNMETPECMSAYFVQKPTTPYELVSGEGASPLKLYSEKNFLPRWDNQHIVVNNNILHIVENGSDNLGHMTLLSSPLSSEYNYIVKRLMDLLISGVLILVLLSWIFPIVSILIKLDSGGPILFLQKRNKKGGKIFNCIKFRSMFLNPEADVTATFENDPRITRVGFFLRRYHIDELPQLLNVFKGDMSVVGPRPHMIAENVRYRTFLTDYNSRHQVKPGITGLAQAMGYYGSTAKFYQISGRLKLDRMYIQQWSVALDIRILFKTIGMLFIK